MRDEKEYSLSLKKAYEPRFLNPDELSVEQSTDPDYALKQLEKLNGGKLEITCSRCHHCH